MTSIVVDSSVAAKWFVDENQRDAAMEILDAHRSLSRSIAVPRLLGLELVNAAALKWRWTSDAVEGLVAELRRLRLEVADPELSHVAEWTHVGLTSYDASYVALAEELGCELVTADGGIVAAAPAIARPLDGAR